MKYENLEIVYTNNIPYGIRDNTGDLFFFRSIRRYDGQWKRYDREVEELDKLAHYLLDALRRME